jgi:AP-1 complex subunit beta-1
VRKTAAICVAKLFDINPELVEDQGFINSLNDMLSDSNPMVRLCTPFTRTHTRSCRFGTRAPQPNLISLGQVVANAVAALSEMAEAFPHKKYFELTSATLHKLLTALNECTEWGQVFILDSLSMYRPLDSREAENIVERVAPRLQHANSAVVLSAVKVMMVYMEQIRDQDVTRNLCRKLAPPLVTLTLGSSEPEIQYVALRNINLIVQKRTQVLSSEYKVFFCKYNDPVYVKLEKLEIMIRLANERNVDAILAEFKEYATEIDVEFVRKGVRAIGRVAIKLDRSAERCVNVLLELIQTKVNYVVQEAIVVIKDIFRKYPNRYESIIATLCDSLETLDEPEAKASMVWIIGEYCARIDNAGELLESFLESFYDENITVQVQLLTAVVKLFLIKPGEAQGMVKQVLNMCTRETDNPDLRDRGFVYWRLLSIDIEAAKAVVLSEKPPISDDTNQLESSLLDELILNLANLSSVYQKPPSQFVTHVRAQMDDDEDDMTPRPDDREREFDDQDRRDDYDDRRDDYGDRGGASYEERAPEPQPQEAVGDLLGDLMGDTPAPAAAPPVGGGGGLDDLFGSSGPPPMGTPAVAMTLVCPADKGAGMVVSAGFARSGDTVTLEISVENQSPAPLSGFMVQFNKNSFGLQPTAANTGLPEIQPGSSSTGSMPIRVNPEFVPPPGKAPTDSVQCAMKNSTGQVFYFTIPLSISTIGVSDGQVGKQEFLVTWKEISDSDEVNRRFDGLSARCNDIDAVERHLHDSNVFTIAQRQNPQANTSILYLSMKTTLGLSVLLELTFPQGGGQMGKLAVRSGNPALSPVVIALMERLLKE